MRMTTTLTGAILSLPRDRGILGTASISPVGEFCGHHADLPTVPDSGDALLYLVLRLSLRAGFLPSQNSAKILFERREKFLVSQWSSGTRVAHAGVGCPLVE